MVPVGSACPYTPQEGAPCTPIAVRMSNEPLTITAPVLCSISTVTLSNGGHGRYHMHSHDPNGSYRVDPSGKVTHCSVVKVAISEYTSDSFEDSKNE